ncbi:uncharacterized protein At2g34460, chloroplastic-like isoform X2 [Primulina huaijiensis]|uniref:uncharacterized protein At2g34460, chloroplastic-like isoform X2 n=1 Tax=Primulina huaijiensis TaxID=1492673 RepID=UPI003CC79B3D
MATVTTASVFPTTSLFHFFSFTAKSHAFYPKASTVEGSQVKEEQQTGSSQKKKIFVAGATGSTGKRIVEQLLAKGFSVKAGVRDVEKAKSTFPGNNADLQIVNADVTEGATKLAEAISDDSDAVICATGFRPSWDLTAPWKLQAEQHIRKSGINYTIIRPGGLKNDPPKGNIVMEQEDTLSAGTISRDQVAEVAVEALLCPESWYKVVEIVAQTEAPRRSFEELFSSIKQR